jgi:hypothetical protein
MQPQTILMFFMISVADPGSGIRCLSVPWIRDPGWLKTQDPDPRSGFGMNIPDHNSENLEKFFWVKILKFFDADPIRDPESL